MKALPHTRFSVIPKQSVNSSNNIIYTITVYNPFSNAFERTGSSQLTCSLPMIRFPPTQNRGEKKKRKRSDYRFYSVCIWIMEAQLISPIQTQEDTKRRKQQKKWEQCKWVVNGMVEWSKAKVNGIWHIPGERDRNRRKRMRGTFPMVVTCTSTLNWAEWAR